MLSRSEIEEQEELLRHQKKGIMANVHNPASGVESASGSGLGQESPRLGGKEEENKDNDSHAPAITAPRGDERTQSHQSVKSRYHISTEYAQQQKLQLLQGAGDSGHGEGVAATSSSSLIGKRVRDPEGKISTVSYLLSSPFLALNPFHAVLTLCSTSSLSLSFLTS